MSKDPAVLFYTADFLAGIQFFTDVQCGQYIKLLCQQHQLGHIPEGHMLQILGSKDNPVWVKFIQDEKTLWFNARMDIEKQKRANYVENRKKIGILGGRPKKNNHMVNHMVNHMGNHMGNHSDNVNDNIDINSRSREGSVEGGDPEEGNGPTIRAATLYCAFFESLWLEYPLKGRVGKKLAYRHYQASVKSPDDEIAIRRALKNYKCSKRVQNDFIQNASTWFNNWQDWIQLIGLVCPKCNDSGTYTSNTGYKIKCDCRGTKCA